MSKLQPRDPAGTETGGQWSSGSAANRIAEARKQDDQMTEARKQALSNWARPGETRVPMERVFHNRAVDEFPTRNLKIGLTEYAVTASVTTLIPVQKDLSVAGVKAYMASGANVDSGGQVPHVVRDGNKLYVLDGHHRLAAQIINGAQKVRVRVVMETKRTIRPAGK